MFKKYFLLYFLVTTSLNCMENNSTIVTFLNRSSQTIFLRFIISDQERYERKIQQSGSLQELMLLSSSKKEIRPIQRIEVSIGEEDTTKYAITQLKNGKTYGIYVENKKPYLREIQLDEV